MEKNFTHKRNGTESWPVVRLGEVCDTKIQRLKSIQDTFIDYIDISSINRTLKRVERTYEYHRKDAPGRAQQVVKEGDLLVSTVRPNLNAVALVKGRKKFQQIASTGFCVLRSLRRTLPDYLYYFVQTARFIDPVVAVSEKAAYPSVTDSVILSQFIPLPPLSVQQEIVARLEKELGKADELAAESKRLGELADELFKSELDATFKNVKGEKVRIGDVGRVVTGSTPSKACKAFYGDSYPFFKPADLNQGYNVISAGDGLTEFGWKAARQLPLNAVLVTCIGATLGKTGIIRTAGSCNQQINALICDKTLPEFTYYFFISPKFQADLWHDSHAITLPIVPKSKFENFKLPFPPLVVQREIVARLDAARERSEKLKAAAERGAALAAELRKSILQEAFQ